MFFQTAGHLLKNSMCDSEKSLPRCLDISRGQGTCIHKWALMQTGAVRFSLGQQSSERPRAYVMFLWNLEWAIESTHTRAQLQWWTRSPFTTPNSTEWNQNRCTPTQTAIKPAATSENVHSNTQTYICPGYSSAAFVPCTEPFLSI